MRISCGFLASIFEYIEFTFFFMNDSLRNVCRGALLISTYYYRVYRTYIGNIYFGNDGVYVLAIFHTDFTHLRFVVDPAVRDNLFVCIYIHGYGVSCVFIGCGECKWTNCLIWVVNERNYTNVCVCVCCVYIYIYYVGFARHIFGFEDYSRMISWLGK